MNVGAASAAISKMAANSIAAEPDAQGWTGVAGGRVPEATDPALVLRLLDIGFDVPGNLLESLGLQLVRVADGETIPGSFWGECEAGLVGSTVYARADTPVHSLLHEASHLLVMPPDRRAAVHTDASDSILEEDAACYLQIVLADAIEGVGSDRLMQDMDAWGYSFRLGSARAWFESDADDARRGLQAFAPGLLESFSR